LPDRLSLPEVTLCAASSVNVAATIKALEASLGQIEFAACKLFSDTSLVPSHPGITVVPIPRLTSAAAYSEFMLCCLVDHVDTSHCLVVQWDGHVIDAKHWRPEFLDYDFIGASWPQFADGHDVGNGGFSLRSRRLMAASQAADFRLSHPEDVAIARTNRSRLEEQGMRFAPRTLADSFSAERTGDPKSSFGYHGVWHMPGIIGEAAFWDIYRSLDDRSTIGQDLSALLKQVGRGPGGLARAVRLTVDATRHALSHKWNVEG
jgi:hypothetical protein